MKCFLGQLDIIHLVIINEYADVDAGSDGSAYNLKLAVTSMLYLRVDVLVCTWCIVHCKIGLRASFHTAST